MSGDFGDWNQEPTHAAPPKVAAELRKRDGRRDLLVFLVKVAVILAGAGYFVWRAMR